MVNAEDIIDAVIRREGGFVMHPADKGSATNHGITISTLADWRGHPVTVDDVRNLTIAEAHEIYRERYLIAPKLHKIADAKVRALALDCAVNHGPSQAVKFLQLAVRVFPDGILGPKSEAAINRMDPRALYARLCAARVRFYGQIIRRDHTQAVFAEGWANRCAEFIEDVAP